jgi:hypothetical protein
MATVSAKPNDVELVIEYAQAEARVLLRQRAEITRRLTAIRRTIVDLARTFGHNLLGPGDLALTRPPRKNRQGGLTEACRAVLLKASQPLTAQEIVEQMRASNPELISHHKDPIASATSILLRLESYGEASSEPGTTRRRSWMPMKSDQIR